MPGMTLLDALANSERGQNTLLNIMGAEAPLSQDNGGVTYTQNDPEIVKGLRRGVGGVVASGGGLKGALQDLWDRDAAMKSYAEAQAMAEEVARRNPAAVKSIRDITLSNALDFGMGALGEGIPSAAIALTGGGLGRAALSRAAPNFVKASPFAAELAGGSVAMAPMEGGEAAMTLANDPVAMANTTPLQRLGLIAGKGAINSVMEAAVPAALGSKLAGGTLAEQVAKGAGLKHVLKTTGQGALGESATEGVQELVGTGAHMLANPSVTVDPWDIADAAAKGGVPGAVMGTVGGGVDVMRSRLTDGTPKELTTTAGEKVLDGISAAGAKAGELAGRGVNALETIMQRRRARAAGEDMLDTFLTPVQSDDPAELDASYNNRLKAGLTYAKSVVDNQEAHTKQEVEDAMTFLGVAERGDTETVTRAFSDYWNNLRTTTKSRELRNRLKEVTDDLNSRMNRRGNAQTPGGEDLKQTMDSAPRPDEATMTQMAKLWLKNNKDVTDVFENIHNPSDETLTGAKVILEWIRSNFGADHNEGKPFVPKSIAENLGKHAPRMLMDAYTSLVTQGMMQRNDKLATFAINALKAETETGTSRKQLIKDSLTPFAKAEFKAGDERDLDRVLKLYVAGQDKSTKARVDSPSNPGVKVTPARAELERTFGPQLDAVLEAYTPKGKRQGPEQEYQRDYEIDPETGEIIDYEGDVNPDNEVSTNVNYHGYGFDRNDPEHSRKVGDAKSRLEAQYPMSRVSEVGLHDQVKEEHADDPVALRDAENALIANKAPELRLHPEDTVGRTNALKRINQRYRVLREEVLNDGDKLNTISAKDLKPDTARKNADGKMEPIEQTAKNGFLFLEAKDGKHTLTSTSKLLELANKAGVDTGGKVGAKAVAAKVLHALTAVLTQEGSNYTGRIGIKFNDKAKEPKWFGSDESLPSALSLTKAMRLEHAKTWNKPEAKDKIAFIEKTAELIEDLDPTAAEAIRTLSSEEELTTDEIESALEALGVDDASLATIYDAAKTLRHDHELTDEQINNDAQPHDMNDEDAPSDSDNVSPKSRDGERAPKNRNNDGTAVTGTPTGRLATGNDTELVKDLKTKEAARKQPTIEEKKAWVTKMLSKGVPHFVQGVRGLAEDKVKGIVIVLHEIASSKDDDLRTKAKNALVILRGKTTLAKTEADRLKNEQRRAQREVRIEKKDVKRDGSSVEQPTASKTMVMRFKDGTVFGGITHTMRSEYFGKSTIELIASGDRTATTRREKPDVSVGDLITMNGGNGRQVVVRVTKAPYQLKWSTDTSRNSANAEKWSALEGWSPAVFEAYAKMGAWQFQYELAEKKSVTVENRKVITRDMVKSEPNTLFLFGDNDKRTGLGGQALSMRGEPNSVGVRTKSLPSMSSDAFWTDASLEQNKQKIDEDLRRAFEHTGKIVIPLDGLGTGRAELAKRAPKTFTYLQSQLDKLGSKEGATEDDSTTVSAKHRDAMIEKRKVDPASVDPNEALWAVYKSDGDDGIGAFVAAFKDMNTAQGMAERDGLTLVNDVAGNLIRKGNAQGTTDANDRPLHYTSEGIKNFWEWFNGVGQSGVEKEAGGGNDRSGVDRSLVGIAERIIVDGRGRPRIFFHGTKDDVTAFDINHPNRKDKGWLGRGVYVTSSPELAELYAGQKRVGDAAPNVMPLYAAVKNPLIVPVGQKKKLSSASQAEIDAWTEKVKSAGHDGVAIKFSDGTIELVAFEANQVKSAIGNAGTFSKSDDLRSSAQKPGKAQPITEERKQAIRAEINKALGEGINLAFAPLIKGPKGERWSGEWTTRGIRIALGALDPLGVARHESIHQLFQWLREAKADGIQELLQNVATNKTVNGQLRRLLKDDPHALKQLSDPEEAAAYLYQFWKAGMVKLGPKSETFFEKVATFLRTITGLLTKEARDMKRAEEILQAFSDGKMSKDHNAVIAAMEKDEQIRKAVAEQGQGIVKAFRNNKTLQKVAFTAAAVLEDTKNPHFMKLSRMFHTPEGEAMGKQGLFEATAQMRAEKLNKLRDILIDHDKEDLDNAIKHLQSGTELHKIADPVLKKIVGDVRSYLKEMHEYMQSRNMQRFNEDTKLWENIPAIQKNFFPVVMKMEELVGRPEEFVERMLKVHTKELEHLAKQANEEQSNRTNAGPLTASATVKDREITVKDIAEAILARMTSAAGAKDITESTSSLGITPYAKSVNRRTLYWLDHKQFLDFMEPDLVKTLTNYTVQVVKRGEYTSRFGNEGEKITELVEKAYAHELMGGDEKQLAKAQKHLEAMQKEWANQQQKGIEADYPTLRDAAEAILPKEGAQAKITAAYEKIANPIKAIMAGEGTLGRDITPELRTMIGGITAYQNARLMALSLFTSFADPVGIVVRGGEVKEAFDAFTRGLKEVWKGWKGEFSDDDKAKFAESLGTVDAGTFLDALGETYSSVFIQGKLKQFNDKLFHLNGMEAWNRSMRISATWAAKGFIERHLTKPTEDSKRYLQEELGLDPAKKDQWLKEDGTLNEAAPEVRQAIMRWVDGAILRPNAMQRPILASDPHYTVFYHLKQFTYSFHKTILKRAYVEMQHGNYLPATALVAGYAPVMIAADVAKELLVPGDDPDWMKAGLGAYVSHGLGRAGLMGIPQLGYDAISNPFSEHGSVAGSAARGANLLGPQVGQVAKILANPFDDSRGAMDDVVGAMPGTTILGRMAGTH